MGGTTFTTTIPKSCGRGLRNEIAIGCRRVVGVLKSSGPTVADDNDTATRPFTCYAPGSETPRGSSDRPETRPASLRSLFCC